MHPAKMADLSTTWHDMAEVAAQAAQALFMNHTRNTMFPLYEEKTRIQKNRLNQVKSVK